MFWVKHRQPEKQTDWQAGSTEASTQLWQRNPQDHMVVKIVYAACLTLLSLITLIMLKFMLPTDSCLCYFGEGCCLGLSLTIQLSLALSLPSSHTCTHTHTHYVPFLCLSLLTAQPHRHTQFSMACHSLVLCELSKLTTQSGNSVPGGEGGKENPLTGAGKKSGERERNGIRAIHTSYKTCSFHKILFFIQSSGSLHLIVLVWNSIVQRRETHT